MIMNIEEQLGPEWYKLLGPLFSEPWMERLGRRLGAVGHLRPSLPEIFQAYRLCQPSQIKVLILAQDPYPHKHANGLAFSSTQPDLPLTLKIVNRELERTGYGTLQSGDLTPWAKQGVFLLNTVLTCEEGQSLAHKGWGWEQFTGHTLRLISIVCKQPYVVLAWGKYAQELIRQRLDWSVSNCEVLIACHPVAESYSEGRIKFVGCGHFEKTDKWLTAHGVPPVNWTGTLPSWLDLSVLHHLTNQSYGH